MSIPILQKAYSLCAWFQTDHSVLELAREHPVLSLHCIFFYHI